MHKARKFIATAAVALVASGVAYAVGPVPRKAPDLSILTQQKQPISLPAFRGKVVVLALLYTNSSQCQKFVTVLSNLQKEYEQRGVQFVAAFFDPGAAFILGPLTTATNIPAGYSSLADVLNFLQLQPGETPLVPILVFIDQAGIIRAQHLMNSTSGDNAQEAKFFAHPETSIPAALNKMLKPASSPPAKK